MIDKISKTEYPNIYLLFMTSKIYSIDARTTEGENAVTIIYIVRVPIVIFSIVYRENDTFSSTFLIAKTSKPMWYPLTANI